jgi:GTP-binding protein
MNKPKDAARLAAGADGETPCEPRTLQYVANYCAKVGALEASMKLAWLHNKGLRTKHLTPGLKVMQNVVQASALYLQATATNLPKLLAAHGAQVSLEVENMMPQLKGDILAVTPHRRFRELTEPFNQLIRWYGKARLVPQALRACEIMNELGIPRNDMTLHFLARACAHQVVNLKRAKQFTQVPPEIQGRPEVLFIGRVNSGKSQMINALFSAFGNQVSESKKTKGTTRFLQFTEVNRTRVGLPHFCLVDSPGLGHANMPVRFTRHWPEMIYSYMRQRKNLVHIFHLVDARNKRLLPADRTLLHLLATAQRRSVRYTIVVSKFDIVTRKRANATAMAIKEELSPYFDVDIMFASAQSGKGVDQLWSKIWGSVTETPRGRRHKEIGARELAKLRQFYGDGVQKADQVKDSLADMLGVVEAAPAEESRPIDFDDPYDGEQLRDFDGGEDAGAVKEDQYDDRYFIDDWDSDRLSEEAVLPEPEYDFTDQEIDAYREEDSDMDLSDAPQDSHDQDSLDRDGSLVSDRRYSSRREDDDEDGFAMKRSSKPQEQSWNRTYRNTGRRMLLKGSDWTGHSG